MKPINIPPATVEAHGAAYVSVSAPLDFEFTDGTKPEAFEGMRVGDVVYTLIGVETDGEMEALNRTRCFYLGFYSGNIPIFTVRVADIIFGDPPAEEEILPVLADNYELHQWARDAWPTFINGDVAWHRLPTKTRWVIKVGTDDRHQDVFMSEVIEAGNYLLHNFVSGKTMVVPEQWLEFLYGEGIQKIEPSSEEELHNLGEELESVREEIPDL